MYRIGNANCASDVKIPRESRVYTRSGFPLFSKGVPPSAMGKCRRVADSREKRGREERKDTRKLIRLSRERWGGKTADGRRRRAGGRGNDLVRKDAGERRTERRATVVEKRGRLRGRLREGQTRTRGATERDGERVRESIGLLIPPPPERVGCALYTVLPVLPASARASFTRANTRTRTGVGVPCRTRVRGYANRMIDTLARVPALSPYLLFRALN